MNQHAHHANTDAQTDNQNLLDAFQLAEFENSPSVTRNELENAKQDWSIRLAQLIHVQQLGFNKQVLIDKMTQRLEATQYLLDHFEDVTDTSTECLAPPASLGMTL